MTMQSVVVDRAEEDPVSNVLKWILLAVAVICFVFFAYVAFSYLVNGVGPWNGTAEVTS